MKFQRPSLFLSQLLHPEQAGIISLLALLEIAVLLAFGLGILYFTQTGMQNTRDYQQEMTMHSQIAGEVEADGRKNLEADGSNAALLPRQLTIDDGTYRHVITHQMQGDKVYVIGGIFSKGKIEQKKLVKGLWQKEGNHYVFQGWVP